MDCIPDKRASRNHASWDLEQLMFIVMTNSGEAIEMHFVSFVAREDGTAEVLSRLTTDTTLVQSMSGVGISITLRSALNMLGALDQPTAGEVWIAGFRLHPLVLIFALSGSLMISRIRIPKL